MKWMKNVEKRSDGPMVNRRKWKRERGIRKKRKEERNLNVKEKEGK